MSRTRRFLYRGLLAGALGGAAYLVWLSSVGSPSPAGVLPSGAAVVVEMRGAEALAGRLSGTRFAAAFAQSATRQVLERTALVAGFDAALAEIERFSGFSPGRASAFDLIGAEAAAGWYPPPDGSSVAAPWVGAGRLSLRAWAVAAALRLGVRFGAGSAGVGREEVAGRELYTIPASGGEALHVFLAGRVLVAGSDRSLIARAANAAGKAGAGAIREPAFQAIRQALPAPFDLFVWLRDRETVPPFLPALLTPGAARAGGGGAGLVVRCGKTIEIDAAALDDSPNTAAGAADDATTPIPAIALLGRDPLFFLAIRKPAPALLTEALQSRRSAVARLTGGVSPPSAAVRTGAGYAVVVTDSAGGTGLFPKPRGLVTIGMASAPEAARALPLLFPPHARSATGGGALALSSRESFPLAGQFELWGAAIGPRLVFATDTSLLDAAAAEPEMTLPPDPAGRSWQVDAIAALSMDKALPLVRRWSAPLSGLVAASHPLAPDVARDLGLLDAVGAVRVAAGSDGRFARAAVTLGVRDLR